MVSKVNGFSCAALIKTDIFNSTAHRLWKPKTRRTSFHSSHNLFVRNTLFVIIPNYMELKDLFTLPIDLIVLHPCCSTMYTCACEFKRILTLLHCYCIHKENMENNIMFLQAYSLFLLSWEIKLGPKTRLIHFHALPSCMTR